MKLNARQVDAAKPREKAYKLADGAGLYLEVVPSGSNEPTGWLTGGNSIIKRSWRAE